MSTPLDARRCGIFCRPILDSLVRSLLLMYVQRVLFFVFRRVHGKMSDFLQLMRRVLRKNFTLAMPSPWCCRAGICFFSAPFSYDKVPSPLRLCASRGGDYTPMPIP